MATTTGSPRGPAPPFERFPPVARTEPYVATAPKLLRAVAGSKEETRHTAVERRGDLLGERRIHGFAVALFLGCLGIPARRAAWPHRDRTWPFGNMGGYR